MKKLLKMLKHNIGLKILAFVFAVGLWLYVFNVEDPEITRSFTAQVSFENTETLSDQDKSYEVLNESDTIRVTVSAQRSIIEKLSSSDFIAVADFDDLTEEEQDGTQELEVYVSLNRYSSYTSIVSETRYVTVSIEDELSKEISVSAQTQGTPADGYAVGSVETLPKKIKVTGVSSLVEQIESASVTVDVSGMSESQTVTADVVFYDASGAVADMSELTVNYESVEVYVDCDVVKTVEVTASETGTPASGYRVTDVALSVSEIQVQGEEDALEDLTRIVIDGDVLDVTDRTQDLAVTVSASEYLPYGVSMYGEDVEITVTVSVTEYETVTVSDYPTSNIEIEGLSDGYTVTFEDETIGFNVSAPVTMNGSVSVSAITLTADLSDRDAGTYTVVLRAQLPDLVYLSTSISVTLVISEE